MSVREQAIEVAARAIGESMCDHWEWAAACHTCDAKAALDAALPALLNDLADRIEADIGEEVPSSYYRVAVNRGYGNAAALVRAAAEGWTE